ncbi:MAG: RnfH family protein [Buchnera aphidicola (Eriosoma harunire)]
MYYINITIVYALPEEQLIKKIKIKKNSNAEAAIYKSKILEQININNIYKHPIGIYGQIITLDYILHDGDRIEFYRKLVVNPMEQRRKNQTYYYYNRK